ncbi:MAG: hypothetical protein KKE02_01095 [Alphaproteobacteria bacterium]|nr:hypothetical protein [Alphaproteobacteria bacterium]MBU1515595.1 hypothetical protein [Alphaproteobacteria bacterium]MBU2096930.1 hypothetical protein [Alphaproteobacteria bacterium]MBU2149585.1 hypothetical protein [Alphaproteobacteria bacterium]MBU2305679.1 hypothetical protein [Alphaproteobacteria bacterium]
MLRFKLPAVIAGLLGVSQPAEPPAPPVRLAPVADGCAAQSAPALDLEIPFAYAGTDLTETGHARLVDLGAWLWCHPGARVVLTVTTEPHYKRPDIERDLVERRRQTVTAYLRDRGLGDDRLAEPGDGAPALPGSARLNLRGRGW